MKKIIKAIESKEKQNLNKFISDLESVNELHKLLSHWYYTELIPKGKDVSKFTLLELKSYLIKRKEKSVYKSIERQVNRVSTIQKSGKLIDAKITIEWKKSKMWGSNPTAECTYSYRDANGDVRTNRVYSGSVGGCGYDKESTAVANCLNQINEVLKPLYLLKDKNINIDNHVLFGYGTGYGITPSIEGGVGVLCYNSIFNKIGYDFKCIAIGRNFDVFTIS